MGKQVIEFLIFPGFLFSALAGLVAAWIDRKITARLQWRIGPPWYQNFLDLVKLLAKEIVIPFGSGRLFFWTPWAAVFAATLGSTLLGNSLFGMDGGFNGDLIVVLYLLTIPAIALMLGASASANPLASVGASREMKLLLSYELPFLLAISVVVVKSRGAIRLDEIITFQQQGNSFFFYPSGLLAFFAAFLASLGKLGMGPFDVSEAEQEIMAGVLVEYSGFLLALFKLSKAILLYVMPMFLIAMFLGKDLSPLFLLGKFLLILGLFILIKNTNPRLRIDQVMNFFWRPVTSIAALGLGLAIAGF